MAANELVISVSMDTSKLRQQLRDLAAALIEAAERLERAGAT